jgi:hypothetical protein
LKTTAGCVFLSGALLDLRAWLEKKLFTDAAIAQKRVDLLANSLKQNGMIDLRLTNHVCFPSLPIQGRVKYPFFA